MTETRRLKNVVIFNGIKYGTLYQGHLNYALTFARRIEVYSEFGRYQDYL